jgi:hypothetical protein
MTLMTSCLSLLLCLAPLAPDDQVFRSPKRQFYLPVQVDPEDVEKIKEVQLFVSWDKGKTWEQLKAVKAKRGVDKILFTAPRDGEVWFTVRTIAKDGTASPEDLKKSTNIQKVLIQTDQKTEPTKPPEPEEKETETMLKKRIAELEARLKQLEERVKELESRPGKEKK